MTSPFRNRNRRDPIAGRRNPFCPSRRWNLLLLRVVLTLGGVVQHGKRERLFPRAQWRRDTPSELPPAEVCSGPAARVTFSLRVGSIPESLPSGLALMNPFVVLG